MRSNIEIGFDGCKIHFHMQSLCPCVFVGAHKSPSINTTNTLASQLHQQDTHTHTHTGIGKLPRNIAFKRCCLPSSLFAFEMKSSPEEQGASSCNRQLFVSSIFLPRYGVATIIARHSGSFQICRAKHHFVHSIPIIVIVIITLNFIIRTMHLTQYNAIRSKFFRSSFVNKEMNFSIQSLVALFGSTRNRQRRQWQTTGTASHSIAGSRKRESIQSTKRKLAKEWQVTTTTSHYTLRMRWMETQ